MYYLFHTKSFKLNAGSFAVKRTLLKRILPLGISSFLTQLSIVIVMGVMNNVLVKYGAMSRYGADIPMTVVGIVMKVFQIVIAFTIGVAAGSQPVVGYNYGAGQYGRVKEIYKIMMIVEVCIGLIATVCFEMFPLQILSLFGSESDLYNEFGVLAFRIFLCTIILLLRGKGNKCIFTVIRKTHNVYGVIITSGFCIKCSACVIFVNFIWCGRAVVFSTDCRWCNISCDADYHETCPEGTN